MGSREKIARVMRELNDRDDVLILDTETTGLGLTDNVKHPSFRAQMVELAIITTSGRTLYNQRFLPTVHCEPEAEAVHGITRQLLALEPFAFECWGDICRIMNGRRVIAFNAEFDKRIIAQSFDVWGLAAPLCKWHCAMKATMGYLGRKRRIGLARAREALGLSEPRDEDGMPAAHSALGDVLRTGELLVELAKNGESK